MVNSLTRAAARGTLATFLLRILSFLCTQWTLRILDPTTLGRASIQLELMLTTVLFLSREGFRLALTRDTGNNESVIWLSVPSVTLVSLVALFYHLSRVSDTEDKDYRLSGILYCIASCIEGLAEPAVLVALRRLQVTKKASAEGIATVAKTMATVVALSYLQESWPVTAMGVAQLTYAIVYFSYLYLNVSVGRPVLRDWDSHTCYMVLVFTGQGIFKHCLTEADRIALSALSDSYDQGVYAMGSAYGGLAARLLLQPMEENARLLWSRMENRQLMEESYCVLVKLVIYIGLVFSCWAVNYTSLLLNLLAGRKWGGNAEATAVLSSFCVYTAFLAWNGMTEAFVYATASSMELGRLSVAHTTVGIMFGVMASVAVSRYGTIGLVGINCIAMMLRTIYSITYAARYLSQTNKQPALQALGRLLREVMPHPIVWIAFVGSFFLTRISNQSLGNINIGDSGWLHVAAKHVAVGITCALGVLPLAYVLERDLRRNIKSLWHGKTE